MSLAYSGVEPQPALAWQFENSNVDSVTSLAPSSQVSPGPAQLQGSAALVTNAPTSNTAVSFPGTPVYSCMNLGANSPAAVDAKTSNIFVECWVYQTASSTPFYQGLLGTSEYGMQWVLQTNGGTPQIFIQGSVNSAFGNVVPQSIWTHVAFSWALGPTSNTAYGFVNGIQSLQVTSTTPVAGTLGNAVIGNVNGSLLNGYIRDLRVVQGGVVPTASFTPGAAPFSYALPSYVTGSGSVVFTLLGQFVTYVPGKYGQGIYFVNNNAIGYGSPRIANCYSIYTISQFKLSANNSTVSVWMNPYYSPTFGGNIYNFSIADAVNDIEHINNPSGNPGPSSIGNYNTPIIKGADIVTGQWMHASLVFSNVGASSSNSTVTYYLNGVSQGFSNINASTSVFSTISLGGGTFGGNGNHPSWLSLDDLRIYNTALTATQVASVYSSQGAPAPSLAMPLPTYAWDFNGTTTDYVSGLSAITPTQLSGYSSFMITTAPTSNTAAYFPGNASQMLTAAGPLNNLNLTTTNVFAESLVYMNSIIASPSIILSKGKKTDPADWWFGINNTGTFQATVTNTGGTPFTASTSTNLATGSWNHVAFSYVASTKVIYVWLNGANQGSATLTGTANNYSSFFTYMAWDGGSQYANMYVRDIRVVSGGVVPTSTTFAPTVAPWGLAQAAYVTGMGTSIYAFPSQTINYTPGIYGQAIVLTNPLNQTAHPNNYVTWTLSPSLGSTTTAYGYTVSFWFKPTSTAWWSQQMVDIAGFNVDGDWRFFLVNNSNLQFSYLINDSASTTTYKGITSTVNYTVNGWNHAAVSLYESATGTSICLYLNNILQGTLTSQWGSLRTFSKLGIGNYPSGQTYPFGYNGSVDDLRVYNTALTSTQVQSIYNQQGVPGRGVVNGITPNITQTPVATIYGNQITPADTSTSKPTTSVSGQTTYSNTSSQYTQFGSGLALTPATTGLTISIVLTFNNGVFTTENLFYFGGNGNYQISVRLANYDALAFQFWDSIASRFISYNPPFTPIASWSAGVKYYFTFTITPVSTTTVNYSVYVNGAVNGSGSGTSTATALNNGTYTITTIGANNNGAYANMTVYDFFVLNTVLSDSQVSTLYQKQLANSNYQIAPPAALTGTPLFSQLSPAATSSAVGAFSLRAVNGTSVRAVNVRPVALFPPAPMTSVTSLGGNSFSQTLPGYGFGGSGNYIVTSSSYVPDSNLFTEAPFRVFDNNPATYWENNFFVDSGYNNPGSGGSNAYSGSYTTTVSGTSIGGEWLQIQLPLAVPLTSYSMYARSGFSIRMPYQFVIAGSNDGTTWTTVDSQTGLNTWSGQTPISFTVNSTTPWLYFRLIVRAIQGNGSIGQDLNIAQWSIYSSSASWNTDFYADRLGNLLTAPVVGQSLANWLGGATGYVTTWYDQSGQGKDLVQPTAANQAVINTSTSPCSLIFNGTSTNMYNSNFTFNFGATYNYTIRAVVNNTVGGCLLYKGVVGFPWNLNGYKKWYLGAQSSGNEASVGGYPNHVGNGEGYVFGQSAISTSESSVTWSSSGFSSVVLYENASSVTVSYSSRASGFTDQGTYLYLGAGGSSAYYSGNVYEIEIFSTPLGAADVTIMG